nr:DUF4968 domain-containing protein [Pyrinomonadaceae bacterium]
MNRNFYFQRRTFIALLLCACGVLLADSSAQGAWRTAGDVVRVSREGAGVRLALSSGAQAFISFVSPNTVRVRLTPRGAFEPDESYAVLKKERPVTKIVLRETTERVELTAADGARVVINRRPFLVSVLDAENRFIVEDDPKRPAMFDPETGEFEATKRRDETETYYGFGEKALPMSRHNQVMAMWNTDTYAYPPATDPVYQTIPFFIALRKGHAYGLFFDNTYRSRFDMGKTSPERYTFGATGGELNYYVFTGGDGAPASVLRDYTELTGRAPMPPLWALGYQQSRWSY